MSTVYSRLQLSPSELRCSPHTTYYTNFLVLRTAVTINGQAAEICFSEKKQLTLNCRYPSTNYLSLTLSSVLSEWEVVLNEYGVSHISNFWCEEVPYFQVGFSSEHNLRSFLHSQQRMEIAMASVLTRSASTVVEDMSCEVDTELFLVTPDVERKDAQITRVTNDNCSSCQAVWKESRVFEFGTTFRTYLTRPKQSSTVIKGVNLKLLVSELSDVVDWFHLGLYLGVPHSELQTIEADHRGQTKRCRTEMLNWWVDNEEQPLWPAVVRALLEIRMRGLAQKIAVKYAVLWETQMSLSTARNTQPIQTTGSQTVPIQLPPNIQRVCSRLEERDEELTRISESLPVAKKRKMAASRKHRQVVKLLTAAEANKKRLTTRRDATRKHLGMKDGELRCLKRLRKIEKKNAELQAIIADKEGKILQLKEQLAAMECELTQTREEIQHLREQHQQTKLELEQNSTQVREMEKVKAAIEEDRSRADKMIIQFYAIHQGLQSQQERVTPAEINALRQTVKEKEEIVVRLSSQLGVKETERKRLLAKVEGQSHHEANPLVQLTVEDQIRELKASLVDAEDRIMELEGLNSRRHAINQPAPHNCKAVGRGLQFGETNQITQFQVQLTDANGEPCSERQEVCAELQSLVDGSITQAEVAHLTRIRSASCYKVSYKPSIRGRCKLSVLVNAMPIAGSPFKVYIQQPPQLMPRQPVKVIRGLSFPQRATLNSSGQLIVTDLVSISAFDSQGKLVYKIDSLGQRYSTVKLHPTGVAIDDSGALYVCDYEAYKLLKVSPTGKVLKSVGGKGNGPGQFDYPDGSTLRDNMLYICDVNNHRIQIFDSDLNFISSFGSFGTGKGRLYEPRDIALDQEGNMYVVDGNHHVQVFSPSGIFIRTFGRPGRGCGELSRPVGIHVDHNIVYVAEDDNHCISTFSTLGDFVTSFGIEGSKEGEFRRPHGITMDHDGFLYVCDIGNGNIQIF